MHRGIAQPGFEVHVGLDDTVNGVTVGPHLLAVLLEDRSPEHVEPEGIRPEEIELIVGHGRSHAGRRGRPRGGLGGGGVSSGGFWPDIRLSNHSSTFCSGQRRQRVPGSLTEGGRAAGFFTRSFLMVLIGLCRISASSSMVSNLRFMAFQGMCCDTDIAT